MDHQKTKKIGAITMLICGIVLAGLGVANFGGNENTGSALRWLLTGVGLAVAGAFLLQAKSK